MAVLRHILQALSGIIVTLGYLDEGTATEVVGVLMSVGSLVWFLLERRKNERTGNAGTGPIDNRFGHSGGGAGGDMDIRADQDAFWPEDRTTAPKRGGP